MDVFIPSAHVVIWRATGKCGAKDISCCKHVTLKKNMKRKHIVMGRIWFHTLYLFILMCLRIVIYYVPCTHVGIHWCTYWCILFVPNVLCLCSCIYIIIRYLLHSTGGKIYNYGFRRHASVSYKMERRAQIAIRVLTDL